MKYLKKVRTIHSLKVIYWSSLKGYGLVPSAKWRAPNYKNTCAKLFLILVVLAAKREYWKDSPIYDITFYATVHLPSDLLFAINPLFTIALIMTLYLSNNFSVNSFFIRDGPYHDVIFKASNSPWLGITIGVAWS